MRHFTRWMMLLGSTLALAGCALETADAPPDETPEAASEELTFGDAPSIVTFYETQTFGGAAYSVEIPVGTLNESLRLIPNQELVSAGLAAKVSAVRLQCGSRGARVVLFSVANTSSLLGYWSAGGVARPIDCTPGQTVQVNLHTEAPSLADNVGSVYFVRHANQAVIQPFSWALTATWKTAMETELPSGASADGDPLLKLTSSTRFTLRQNLVLDDWKCGDRKAYFSLAVQLLSDRHFSVSVLQTWVGDAWGDAWGCHDEMLNALNDAMPGVTADLDAGLEQLGAFMFPQLLPRFYFVPSWGLREFDLVGGGQSSDLVFISP